jgi:2-polyprenyl-3-methyl-5-hydroxy-6-metoxy-1,4-benzoquinol methylase
MAQMTDVANHLESVKEFYDSLSAEYDLMTDFQGRFVRERPFFHMLIDRYHIQSALDAGSGTGFHSVLLAQLGVKVTAVDVSPAMISFVQEHASQRSVDIRAVVAGFEDIPGIVGGSYDAVFSLGNSMAHANSKEELLVWLRAFASVLNPGGILFIQNLNYDRILTQQENVLGTKQSGNKTFERFYEFEGDRVVFNIRTTERTTGGVNQRQRSVSLLPLLRPDLLSALETAGFSDIQSFGGISMSAFAPKTSTDLVMLARIKNIQ